MDTCFEYRQFLRERYQAQKRANPQFSARYFARRAKISSPSYFSMIISGERKLNVKFAKKIAFGLKLNERETKLLIKTAEYETCEDSNQKIRILGEVKKLTQKLELPKLMPISHVDILSRPLELGLYVLSQSNKFLYDAHWIQKQSGFDKLPKTILKKAMQVLIDTGLWQVLDSKIIVKPPNLETGSRLPTNELKLSHLRFLEIAKYCLMNIPADRRVFMGQTFLTDPKKIELVEKYLSQFKSEFESEFEDLNSSSVYQLHLAFFPLTSSENTHEK